MASNAVGFQKLAFSPRLTGAALGAGLGFAASPEDEGQTAALVGGGMGYGIGALGDHLRQRMGQRKPQPAAPAPAQGASHSPAELSAAHAEIDKLLAPKPEHIDQALAAAPKPGPAGPPVGLSPERAKNLARVIAPVRRSPVQLPTSFRKVGFEKVADYNVGTNIGPVGMGTSSKDERLTGMNRWVPRSTIEQAYQGLDQGLDQQALMEQAAASGNLQHPAVGAGLAAALAHFGLPGMPSPSLPGSSKALAALAGGGAGALYNRLTAGNRAEDMAEAVKGVELERNKNPKHHTAREATPMVVSPAGGDH